MNKLIMLLTLMCAPLLAAGADMSSALTTFQSFKASLASNDVAAVIATLSTNTLNALDRRRKVAISARREALLSMPAVEVFSILSLRCQLSRVELERADMAILLFGYTTNINATARFFSVIQVGHVETNGATCAIFVSPKQKDRDVFLPFHLEQGLWKFDLCAFSDQSTCWMERRIAEGESKRDLCFNLLRRQYGHILNDELLDGPREKPSQRDRDAP